VNNMIQLGLFTPYYSRQSDILDLSDLKRDAAIFISHINAHYSDTADKINHDDELCYRYIKGHIYVRIKRSTLEIVDIWAPLENKTRRSTGIGLYISVGENFVDIRIPEWMKIDARLRVRSKQHLGNLGPGGPYYL
jgi:hypothetical protein